MVVAVAVLVLLSQQCQTLITKRLAVKIVIQM
jgi:hypothetical protein